MLKLMAQPSTIRKAIEHEEFKIFTGQTKLSGNHNLIDLTKDSQKAVEKMQFALQISESLRA